MKHNMTMRLHHLIICFICFLTVLPGSAQESRRYGFTIKAGASFGGSKPGSYQEDRQANLMFNFTGGVGVSVFFMDSWQVCLDANYVRKGINCPLDYNPEAARFFPMINEESEMAGWFDNVYIELPLTVGYTWGYDICRTRFGGYVAFRTKSDIELLINGQNHPLDHESDEAYSYYKEQLSRLDAGIKIANEFYLDKFSIGVEFSAGFIPTIKRKWRSNNSQSYTMAVSILAAYTF